MGFLFVVAALAVVFPSLAVSQEVVVRPGESIQAAIDAAPEGAVIVLTEGRWEENLKIEKSLTLRGAGADVTVIGEVEGGFTVILIAGPEEGEPISVTIEGLSITRISDNGNNLLYHGIAIMGSAFVKITNSIVTSGMGIWLAGPVHAEITGCTVTTGVFGIVLTGPASAEVVGCTISWNGEGISILGNDARVTVTDNIICNNTSVGIRSLSNNLIVGYNNTMYGNNVDLIGNLPFGLRVPLMEAVQREIRLPDPAYPTLQHAVDALLPGGRLVLGEGSYAGGVTIDKALTIEAEEGTVPWIEGGEAVISLVGTAQVQLSGLFLKDGHCGLIGGAKTMAEVVGCSVYRNWVGIELMGSAQAAITDSIIYHNWDDGIRLGGSAQAAIKGNEITNNGGYGVALYQWPCYETDEGFTGHVTGRANTILNNGEGAVCPSPELDFLMTEEGGIYP